MRDFQVGDIFHEPSGRMEIIIYIDDRKMETKPANWFWRAYVFFRYGALAAPRKRK